MTNWDIKRLALVFATQAEIEGMKVANAKQAFQEKAITYTYANFCEKAEELRLLAYKHGYEL